MSKFEIAPAFVSLLHEHGLDTFKDVMERKIKHVMRSVPGRSTVRLPFGIYLKRYEPDYYSPLTRWWHHDEAEHEWNMIHELQRAGFRVPTPVAFGRRGARSFVMTAEIAGGVPADTVATPALLERIGKLTRQFHDAGFIHKDYYLCHIFVAGDVLYFIDLQRVLGPRRFSQRWIVKDLAALAHSAARIGVAHEALLRAYGGDDALFKKVAARMQWLKKRRPKFVGVWDDPVKSKAEF
jgi:tRNA A-37 threonylcarbamoyl transferase component Bud32